MNNYGGMNPVAPGLPGNGNTAVSNMTIGLPENIVKTRDLLYRNTLNYLKYNVIDIILVGVA